MKLLAAMDDMGFQKSKVDPCMYFKWTEDGLVLILSWIDDLYIGGKKEAVLKVKAELMDHFEIEEHFIGIEGLDNIKAESKVQKGKDLIKSHSIRFEETLLVGDTLHDFEVAQQIGVDCLLISNGHQSLNRLKNGVPKAEMVIDHIERIKEIRHQKSGVSFSSGHDFAS